MAKKTDKKPVKKPAKKQPTQKQSQKQSVIINLGESKKRVRVRRKKESSEKKGLGISSRGITLHTANYAPPPTYNKFEPQPYISEKLPLSFYETNRPMNMGFNFQYPTVVPIATQTETELIPTLENQLDNNLEIVNNDSSDLPREREPERPAIQRLTQIQNPFTGRMINVGSVMFKKLLRKRIIDEFGNILISNDKLQYLIEEYRLGRFKP